MTATLIKGTEIREQILEEITAEVHDLLIAPPVRRGLAVVEALDLTKMLTPVP